jgi:hypothetical protein
MEHGCWLDGSVWKLRTWFLDADRFTHVRFTYHVDWTLNGFQTDFLQAHQALAAAARAPSGPTSSSVCLGHSRRSPCPLGLPPGALAHDAGGRLRRSARAPCPRQRGRRQAHDPREPDAAHFRIASGGLAFTGSASRAHGTPQDANGDNRYEVMVRVSDTWGHVVDVPHTVVVLPSARASASIVDNFDRADANLDGGAYVMLAGAAGTFGIRGNRAAILLDNGGAVLDMGSLGSSQQEAQANFPGWTSSALVLMRLVDQNNWIGFGRRDFPGNVWIVQMCVAGVVSTLAEFNNQGDLPMRVTLDGRMMQVRWMGNSTNAPILLFRGAPRASRGLPTLIPGLALARSSCPRTRPWAHKVGLKGGGTANPWIDGLSFTRLSS